MVSSRFVALAMVGFAALLPACAGPSSPPALADLQPNAFFDTEQFYGGLRAARANPAPRASGGPVIGGLVPHHILAGALLSELFLELEEQRPTTVTVVGPNHEHVGQRAVTGRRSWATDFGPVEADLALVHGLVAAGLAVVDEEALTAEHSVGALMPYVKHHLPGARVVPIILHRPVTVEEQRRLAEHLAPLLGRERVLVASVDFSHYLTRAEAEAKDVVTLQAIRDFDLPALMRMGPDHLDSPPSLGVLMLTMQQLGAAGPEVAGHTNSGILYGNDRIETTSYFTFKYRKK